MSIPQITDDEKEILQCAIASYGERTQEEKALFGVNLHKKIERLSQYIERDFR